jgi:uncharacterized protein (TIRG00374 family)
MSDRTKTELRRAAGRVLKRTAGIVFAAALLVWVIHDIEGKRLFENVRVMRWGWIAAGLGSDILSYAIRVLRWQVLFRPLGRLSFLRTFEANYAGMFLNEILPMRAGEAARAILVSRRLGVELPRIVPSMVLERILEGIWLAVGAGLVTIFVPLPRDLAEGADLIGAGILLAAAVFILIAVRKPKAAPPGNGGPAAVRKLRAVLGVLGEGFREIGLDRKVVAAFALTLPYFLLQALAFWFLLEAYHIHLSAWIGGAVFLIVHLGTSLPSAPANVGAYQFFCVVGLTLFGIDKTTATGFSIIGFLLLTASILGLGFVAFLRSGLSLGSLRKRPADLL